jgi:hypothetical protein
MAVALVAAAWCGGVVRVRCGVLCAVVACGVLWCCVACGGGFIIFGVIWFYSI